MALTVFHSIHRWYGVVFTYIRSPQESVSTTGPLSQPLTVKVNTIKQGIFTSANLVLEFFTKRNLQYVTVGGKTSLVCT